MRHPFLHPLTHFYVYLAIWAGLTAAHAIFLIQVHQLTIESAFFDAALFNILISSFCFGIWYAVRWVKLDNNKLLRILFIHLAALTLFLTFWACIGDLAVSFLFPNNIHYRDHILSFLPLRIFTGIMYYMVTILFYYLYIYYRSYQENQLKEANLLTVVKQTQLELLKSQLNPHFIFNSLNSISALTLTNPGKAQEMVIKLSSFLRTSLGHKNTQMTSLQRELENCLLYLQIEQVRFGEKLQFTCDTDPLCLQIQVPDMILQPLLENAVKHGVYESTEQVHVSLQCKSANQCCEIIIINGTGAEGFLPPPQPAVRAEDFQPQYTPRPGKGMGIRNVRERLRLLYGQGAYLTTECKANTFTARLTIPFNA